MLRLTHSPAQAFRTQQQTIGTLEKTRRGVERCRTPNTEITIRRVDLIDEDLIALTRLADRDSGTVPNSPVLGLEIEGVLLAAVSLRDGETIADPFLPTEELRDLLGARASQLRRRAKSKRRLPGLSRRQGRPAVGGSPPGQIITLPRWG